MTDEEIFDVAEQYGWMDDFSRWNFKDDDLVKSYEKGFQDALNAEKPSERLEYVCAALWLKGEQK